MSRRSEVLKPFFDRKGYMEDRIREGIESYRKGYGRLQFLDAAGKPVAGGKVTIRQKDHEFKYGANLFMLGEFGSQEQNERYEADFAGIFNIATLPFYWNTLEPEEGHPRFMKESERIYRRPPPDLCLEYCERNGIMPKAHCLNYAHFMPEWAKGPVDKEKRLLAKRFRELAERYALRIRDWEVTNETLWAYRVHDYSNFYMQDDFLEWNFQTAMTYFPGNRLLSNETHCRIWDDDHFYGTRSPYYMQLERALGKGARIDSIGLQFHMFYRAEEEARQTAPFYDPQRLYDVMDTYAKLGRNLQITEPTIPAYTYEKEDEELQAEIIRNLYSIWFSHPAMEAIIYWNLVDGYASGSPQGDMTSGENYFHGGLIRYDFTKKPAYEMVRRLFLEEWRTELTLRAQNDILDFKGFYGNYEVIVERDGLPPVKKEIFLGKGLDNHFFIRL